MRTVRSPAAAARCASSPRRLYPRYGGGGPRVLVVVVALTALVQGEEHALDDQAARLDHAPEVRDGVLVDPEAPVLVGLQEALRGEVDEGLADGGRGDAVLLGDLLDGELLTRLEPSPSTSSRNASAICCRRVLRVTAPLPVLPGMVGASPSSGTGKAACSSVCTSTPPYAFDEIKTLDDRCLKRVRRECVVGCGPVGPGRPVPRAPEGAWGRPPSGASPCTRRPPRVPCPGLRGPP